MKSFFFPDPEGEAKYQNLKSFLRAKGFSVTDRRIFSLSYIHDELRMDAEVGQQISIDGRAQLVLGIFELSSGSFSVCTPIRGAEQVAFGTMPIMVGPHEVTDITFFH